MGITQERLKKLLDYDPLTGVFTWKVSKSKSIRIGRIAGFINFFGYRMISIDNKQYREHRLAWLYIYGEFPQHGTDHVNHVRNDNRISNLRDVKQSENVRNAEMRKDNTSGITGVSWDKRDNKWHAQIKVDRRSTCIYSGDDFFEACCRRKSAEIKYGYHENHGRRLL